MSGRLVTLLVVLAGWTVAIGAPTKQSRAQVVRVAEIAEEDLAGGAKQQRLVEQLDANRAPVALRKVRVLRGKEFQPPTGNFIISLLVLDGALELQVPETKHRRRKLAAVTETIGAGDALYARSPQRPGWKLVGQAEKTNALVVVVPAAKPGPRAAPVAPVVQRAQTAREYEIAGGRGSVRMLFDPAISKDRGAYLGRFTAKNGLTVPEHVHGKEAELLYVQTGFGEMTVNGKVQPVVPGDVVYIPAGSPHAFRATSKDPVEAVQLYTPSGPEQRFKKARSQR